MGHAANRKARRPPVFNAAPDTVADFDEGRKYTQETAYYVGPSTDRVAFSNEGLAKEGDHWQDTDGLKLERVFRSGTWAPTLPPLFKATFRRSDGALIVNSGGTAMRFQDVPVNTLGCTTGADGNGAFVTVPEPGVYSVAASLPVSFGQATWAGMGFGADGATVIEGAAAETNVQSGFGRITTNLALFIPLTTTKIWISLTSNGAGVMRLDGDLSISRRPDIR